MERRGEIDRETGIPLLHRKTLDWRHVLYASVVDDDIDRPERRSCLLDHRADLLGNRHVGVRIVCFNPVGFSDPKPMRLDLVRITEPVQHDVHACGRERLGDPKANAAGRAGDHRVPALRHGVPFVNLRERSPWSH